MGLNITPLTGSIGARVEGVRLDEPMSDELFGELNGAFLEHCVLVFREQYVKPGDQVAFARRFGEPFVTAMLTALDEHPEIVQITKVDKETTATEAWHFDAPWETHPPKISMLSALTVPHGGDTMWSNQYNAYANLSEGLRGVVDGLTCRFRGARLARMMKVPEADIPHTTHPMVRTHPETGRKALYIGHTDNASIQGWGREESDLLVNHLYTRSTAPDNVYRHQWAEGDLVMWDNRCTMHYAVHDYGEQPRVLNRVTLKGEAPA